MIAVDLLEHLGGVGAFRYEAGARRLTTSAHFDEIWQLSSPATTLEDLGGVVHPYDATALLAAFDHAMSAYVAFSMEVRQPVPDDSARVLQLRTEIVRGDDGAILYGVARELTQHEAESSATQRESMRRVADDLAGDLSEPLKAIRYGTARALESLDKSSSAADNLVEVLRAAEHATAVTARLRGFLPQADAAQLIDLRELFRNMAHLLSRIGGPEVSFQMHDEETALPAVVDPDALERVVLSVATHGASLLPGDGRLSVQMGIEPGRDSAERVMIAIEVRTNDGAQLKQGRVEGVWLPGAVALLRPHGGTAEARVLDGEAGWRTELSLPSVGYNFESRVARRPLSPGATSILVVEDEGSVRRSVVRVLKNNGFRVSAAVDGREALRVLESRGLEFDLLITDVVMPYMSGWELAARVATRYPQLQVLVMTGYSDPYGHDGAEIRPAYDRLAKPFTPAQLLDTVQGLLGPIVVQGTT